MGATQAINYTVSRRIARKHASGGEKISSPLTDVFGLGTFACDKRICRQTQNSLHCFEKLFYVPDKVGAGTASSSRKATGKANGGSLTVISGYNSQKPQNILKWVIGWNTATS